VTRTVTRSTGSLPAIETRLRFSLGVTTSAQLSRAAFPASADRVRVVRHAKALSWLSIGWMTIEASVAIVSALIAGSVALLGFGLDSLIELGSAGIVIWRFTGARDHSEAAERRAQKLIAGCFAALAAYLLFDGIRVLVSGSHPATSWPGVVGSHLARSSLCRCWPERRTKSPRSSTPQQRRATLLNPGSARLRPPASW